MTKFKIGDLVVLKSGSMRMCVEEVGEDSVSTVWCNEGVIGRDTFSAALLNKWEFREDTRGGERAGGKPPHRGDRSGDRGGDERKPRKQGWDGKPRDKKYFRKDD